ncbi:MAG TPA: chemotaxis response regulator protein-glutamate methylesterase [Clostridia bacterium]
MHRKIKVLIVDDSMVFREFLAKGISKDNMIEVVATASDPYSARDKILEFEPDVMTLDVEMPRMNGIEFLKRLLPQYTIPVVVVSSVSENVFDALNAGAVDFVTKTDLTGKNAEGLINELITKIKIASVAKVSMGKSNVMQAGNTQKLCKGCGETVIAIGASTGGTEATYSILKNLPGDMPGIVVVQHMPPVFTRMYAERLNTSCRLEVREAKDGDRLSPGKVFIAAGDYHMRIKKAGGSYLIESAKGEKVNGHCPSVDVLFDSVAQYAGGNSIGIILTGMGRDGASGLLKMRKKGARTIGQDEASSVVYGMPKVAYDIGAVERQVTLNNIHQVLISMLGS